MSLMSFTDFAKQIGVSTAMVSKYVSNGQITKDAIVKEGKYRRIIPDLAIKDLNGNLDPGQRKKVFKTDIPVNPVKHDHAYDLDLDMGSLITESNRILNDCLKDAPDINKMLLEGRQALNEYFKPASTDKQELIADVLNDLSYATASLSPELQKPFIKSLDELAQLLGAEWVTINGLKRGKRLRYHM